MVVMLIKTRQKRSRQSRGPGTGASHRLWQNLATVRGCWSPPHRDGGAGTAGWVTPDEPTRRQTQLDATGVSRGCGGPRGPPGVPGRLRGPRSTGASPAAPGPRSPGSRWQATPCCFGCSSASASALCGRSLQNKRCRGLGGGLCVTQGPPRGRRDSFEPIAPVARPLAPGLARRWLSLPCTQRRGRAEG